MRKIMSEKELEARRKRNSTILSLVMLFVLVAGTVGYAFSYSGGSFQSSNSEQEIEGQNQLTINGETLYLTYTSDFVKSVPVNVQLTSQDYVGLPLYIDSENNAITGEIALTVGKLSSRLQEACYLSCPDKDLPEKDCTENLIIWRDSGENKVYQEGRCVFIEGDIRAVDAFIYKLG